MPAETKLAVLAEQGCPVFYFYSTEKYLVHQAVQAACRLLAQGAEEEMTVLDGAAPDVEQLVMAAGTISFFGTRRVVCLPEVDPGAYSEKDLEAFMDTVASLENAVLVLGSVFEAERTGKAKPGKRAQRLIAQCKKLGWAEELASRKSKNTYHGTCLLKHCAAAGHGGTCGEHIVHHKAVKASRVGTRSKSEGGHGSIAAREHRLAGLRKVVVHTAQQVFPHRQRRPFPKH